jgi:transcriptional regulator with GAF, ATPase, and Fis domain
VKPLDVATLPEDPPKLKSRSTRMGILDLPSPRLPPPEPGPDDWPDIDELQRRYIRAVLEKTVGKIGDPDGAAKILGMKRATLYARMGKLGMR